MIHYQKVNAQLPTVPGSTTFGAVILMDISMVDEVLAWLRTSKYFTSLDLGSGYYHIKLSPATRHKSVFITIFGKCKFLMMPFGLSQGKAYFTALL